MSEHGKRACSTSQVTGSHKSLEGEALVLPLFTNFISRRKLDAQVRAAVEMYTEDWIIAHRRWVCLEAAQGGGSRGWV